MALTVMKNKTKLLKGLFIAECLSYCFHNMKDVKQYFSPNLQLSVYSTHKP